MRVYDRWSFGEDVEQRQPPHVTGEDVRRCGVCVAVFQKLKQLPCDAPPRSEVMQPPRSEVHTQKK